MGCGVYLIWTVWKKRQRASDVEAERVPMNPTRGGEATNENVGHSLVRPCHRFTQGSADHEPHRFHRLLEDLPYQDLGSPPTITGESASAQIMHRPMYILPVR